MNFFENISSIFDKENEFIETKNSFFEKHNCNGDSVKVDMQYTIEDDKSGDKIVFGKCKNCNKVFFHVE